MRAKDFITELGDKPYAMPSKWSGATWGVAEKSVKLPDGRVLLIDIESDSGIAIVNFYIDNTQKITGKGDAYKVFSTVANQVADYARKYKPRFITFTSSFGEQSRIKLYDRLVNSAVKTPEFSKYINVTDRKDLWDEDLEFVLDDFQDISDQKLYVFMRKNKAISEAPLQSYTPMGDFDKPGPFRGPDKRLVPHPTNILKTQRFLEQTPYDFRLFFSNIPGTGKYSEYGPMDANQLKEIFGDQADQIINGSEDAITVVFVGNKGDAKVPMTPWIMAHRFGHAIQAGVRKKNSQIERGNFTGNMSRGGSTHEWLAGEYFFFSQINRMLEEYYGKTGKVDRYSRMLGREMIQELNPEYNALFNAIGTQRSSRSGDIKRPYEFFYEIFAQYLGTGKITLNPLPTNLGYGRKAWGTPTKYLNIKPEFRGESDRADATAILARDMEYMFDDVLSSSVGKIFVM